MNGKGDRNRTLDHKRYREGWNAVFGHKTRHPSYWHIGAVVVVVIVSVFVWLTVQAAMMPARVRAFAELEWERRQTIDLCEQACWNVYDAPLQVDLKELE